MCSVRARQVMYCHGWVSFTRDNKLSRPDVGDLDSVLRSLEHDSSHGNSKPRPDWPVFIKFTLIQVGIAEGSSEFSRARKACLLLSPLSRHSSPSFSQIPFIL